MPTPTPTSGPSPSEAAPNRRVLVVDDNQHIHEDFLKILGGGLEAPESLNAFAAALFSGVDDAPAPADESFGVSCVLSGQQGLALVEGGVACDEPYALAFVDMRMPNGWDGMETTRRILAADEWVHVVICTAYSDYTWRETVAGLGQPDRVLILKKPFDVVEVRQLAFALCRKWDLQRQVRRHMQQLQRRVEARTAELERTNDRLRAEMAERQKVELELRHAHKLEAVGQLAAGVAHEINTPIQFIGDSVHFLQEGIGDLAGLFDTIDSVMSRLADVGDPAVQAMCAEVAQATAAADREYLLEEMPRAVDRSLDGVQRVSTIVQAMKRFAHPVQNEAAPADLNDALNTTIVVARSEYRYAADIELDLGELPPVVCRVGDLNQVFLNLIVNAGHAIADVVGSSGNKGTIRVRSRRIDDLVEIAISDTGTGIPAEVQDRIFEPFFTTKEVGRGTGQGLALAYSLVVEGHGGTLTFDTKPGAGTTFFVRLPWREVVQ